LAGGERLFLDIDNGTIDTTTTILDEDGNVVANLTNGGSEAVFDDFVPNANVRMSLILVLILPTGYMMPLLVRVLTIH